MYERFAVNGALHHCTLYTAPVWAFCHLRVAVFFRLAGLVSFRFRTYTLCVSKLSFYRLNKLECFLQLLRGLSCSCHFA